MTMTPAASKYFAEHAQDWDDLRTGYFTEAVRDAAIAKAYLRPEMVVADVGAGSGFMTAGLAPLVHRVYALDGSAEMLAVAKKNLAAFSNVFYQQADITSLNLPEESLDVVFANMVLHHATDPQAAIAEMVRVLRPGGRLVITDMDAHPYTWLKEEMADVWQGFERDQIKKWFEEAGLVNRLVTCTGQTCSATALQLDPIAPDQRQADISIFLATGTRKLVMRSAVEANYAAAARSGSCGCAPGSPCCSTSSHAADSEVIFNPNYSSEEKQAVPEEAAGLSLGCGNPTGMASIRPGETVLDIGSGAGMDAFLAARQVGPHGKVIGVDMTNVMLGRARRAARKAGLTQVEFRKGFAEQLPVDHDSVDVIISNCVINLCEDKGQVFTEAFRVLKPGGRLEVSDMITDNALPLDLRTDQFGWSDCVTGALPQQEYLDLVAQAGFTNITARRSESSGDINDIKLYSAQVSAVKPSLP